MLLAVNYSFKNVPSKMFDMILKQLFRKDSYSKNSSATQDISNDQIYYRSPLQKFNLSDVQSIQFATPVKKSIRSPVLLKLFSCIFSAIILQYISIKNRVLQKPKSLNIQSSANIKWTINSVMTEAVII